MPKLRNKIARYLILISAAIVLLILILWMGFKAIQVHSNTRDEAAVFFRQMDRVLSESNKELEQAEEKYSKTCEAKAKTADYMLTLYPDALYDAAALRQIAAMLEAAELHIFDGSGVMISGTNPEYYGLNFVDGDQISYFLPLLSDKSLIMVQEIRKNTAEQKSMQYSAMWNSTGEYIIQIGVEPVEVEEILDRNTLSHIFSLLNAGEGVNYYAINPRSKVIEGATDRKDVGRHMIAVGLPAEMSDGSMHTVHATVKGVYSYCICETIQGNTVVYTASRDSLYRGLPGEIMIILTALFFVALVLVISVQTYLNRYVLRSIDKINKSLSEITSGNIDADVDVRNTREFSELSSHINGMIRSIMGTMDIMSYIINKTDLHMGVYVYNSNMKYVRFTDYIPELMNLDQDEMKEVSGNIPLFKEYIQTLCLNPLEGERNIYRLPSKTARYIRVDEVQYQNDVMGIVLDMTAEIEKRRRIESERDIDLLTGLFNRRGFKLNMTRLFENPEELGYGAVFMVDADDLKKVNDNYGHSYGDRYLKTLADVLGNFGSKNNISARLGGDEYAMFLYGYNKETDLLQEIGALKNMQDMIFADLGDGDQVIVRFSFGYALTYGETDYSHLLKIADDLMYENKRQRKGEEN